MGKIQVSIIVPVYNVEKYLKKCLNSLVNQTLEEIEIIVVNDGSTDGCKGIIEEYEKKYPKKIIHLEKKNGGPSDARNYGMKFAKGEYIAFLDSDDYAELDMCEKMYNLAKKENSDVVECNFMYEFTDDDNSIRNEKHIIHTYKNKHEMVEKICVIVWNKLIKRSVIEKNNLKFPKGLIYEDMEFIYNLVAPIEKISSMKNEFIHYVQRASSISNKQTERTKDIFAILNNIIEFYKEKGIFEEYKDELEYLYIKNLLYYSFIRMIEIDDKKLRNSLLKQSWKILNEKFPNWKKNRILHTEKSKKNMYFKTLNNFTYKIYCKIFRIVKIKK